jgi:diguanylate cyclase (GGDEF)-like protein
VSFRSRLTLFFVIIVIVPLLATALLLYGLISRSANGQVNASVAANRGVALRLFDQERGRARAMLDGVVLQDRVLRQSLLGGDLPRARKRAGQLVASPRGIERIVIFNGGRVIVDVGNRMAIAPYTRPVRSATAGPLGDVQVSVTDGAGYVRRVKALTGLDATVQRGNDVLGATISAAARTSLPGDGEQVTLGGDDYVVRSVAEQDFLRRRVRISVLPRAGAAAAKIRERLLPAGAILLGFLLAAIACAVLVSKALQQQILGLLAAARRLGQGDYGAEVPTVGKDEFAELGEEFNKMSRQLKARLGELEVERRRVEGSMRRLGEAVASNLDRDALLRLVVSTAVEGVGADAGRVSVRGADRVTFAELSRVGNMNGLEAAVQSVEAEVLRTGAPRETTLGGNSAIAHPVGSRDGDIVGVVSIGRTSRPFTREERELLTFLAGQAGVSMENVDLHEAVARASVTDPLTALSNRRGFDDALTIEIERARRFGTKLGLVLLDLDDFKQINDAYGHQQGDVVLRDVARVLRETAREIDHLARYGGEEYAVLLPETDVQGALHFAERARERIAGLRIQRIVTTGTLAVTTSCGVAAVPEVAVDEADLVAAADAALYEAKRAGKNKSVQAR